MSGTGDAEGAAPGPVTAVADQLLAALAAWDPRAAAAAGEEPASDLPELSPDSFDGRREATGRALAALERLRRRLPVLAPSEALLATVMTERLTADIALDDIGRTRSLLAPLATPLHEVKEAVEGLSRRSAEDWDRLAAHLAAVPGALADWLATLRRSAGAGAVAPARQVEAVAQQCDRWVGAHLFPAMAEGAPAASADALSALGEEAEAAVAGFAAAIRRDLLPIAPRTDGAGREHYAVTARAFLGDEIDLEATYRWGWAEVEAIGRSMAAVASSLGHPSPAAAAAALDADPSQRLEGPEALLRWLRGRLEEATDAVDGVHADLPAAVGRADCRIAPTATGIMWYAPPDPGFRRPGRIWWSAPAAGCSSVWREVTTLHHEGVPGHHLQTAVAMTSPGLHPWQRTMAHVHGHVEGWAHYAEAWAEELGLVRSPAERLGMLAGQRWRAARVVIDLGLHLDLPIPAGTGLTEARRWTPPVGVEVLVAAAGLDSDTARFEVDRYLGWPGQALSFRVGADRWWQARAAAERRAGWDARAWHMGALRLGPMGLGPLRDRLERDGGGAAGVDR